MTCDLVCKTFFFPLTRPESLALFSSLPKPVKRLLCHAAYYHCRFDIQGEQTIDHCMTLCIE